MFFKPKTLLKEPKVASIVLPPSRPSSEAPSHSSIEKDSELIKNVRERIAIKNKLVGKDLLPFDQNLRNSWLNSYTASPTQAKESTRKIDNESSFDCAISKPSNESTYLTPLEIRKRQEPPKNPSEIVNSKSDSNAKADTSQISRDTNKPTINIPTQYSIPKPKPDESKHNSDLPMPKENRYIKNTTAAYPSNANNSSPRKIQKIISALAEKELVKIETRIDKRNARVPELLDDLALARGDEKSKLEKELHTLMRKYSFDKRKFRELKKPSRGQDVDESDENEDRSRRDTTKLKQKTRLEKDIKKFMIHNNFSQESSGYSSYEDSTHSKSQSMESLSLDNSDLKQTTDANKFRRSKSLTKSPTFQSEYIRKALKSVDKQNQAPISTANHSLNRWEASKLQEMSHEVIEATEV